MAVQKGRNFKSPSFLGEINQSLGSYLLNEIRKSQDRVCLVDSVTKEEVKISQILQQSLNLAAELQALGCGRDSVVGLISENKQEYLTVIFAVILTGATLTCFNPAYTAAELQHTFSISRPSILFYTSVNLHKIREVNKIVNCTQWFIALDTLSQTELSNLEFHNLVHSLKKYQFVENSPDDTAFILYSSGTTGFPKGVMLSHRNTIFKLKMNKDECIFGDGVRIFFVPMYHIYGLTVTISSLVMAKPVIVMERFNEEAYLQLVEEYRVTELFLVPTVIKMLIKSHILQKYDVSSVTKVLSGAAILEKNVENELRRIMNISSVQQIYGQTEATMTLVNEKNKMKPGTCGTPFPGVTVKVVDTETGKILGAKQVGEICVKGPDVMKGYYKNEKATSELMDKEGWLHTGDAGYYDEEGDFFIVDRIKDLIKYKEYQVPPAELEALLLKRDDVEDAAVIGIPDAMAGEIPRAFVVKRINSTVTEKELVDYISGLVSPQKRLRGGVAFLSEIPKNQTGKILKKNLRAKYVNVQYSKY